MILCPCPKHCHLLTVLEQDTLSQVFCAHAHNAGLFHVFAENKHAAEECLMLLQPDALSQVFMPFANMPKTLLFAAVLPLPTAKKARAQIMWPKKKLPPVLKQNLARSCFVARFVSGFARHRIDVQTSASVASSKHSCLL